MRKMSRNQNPIRLRSSMLAVAALILVSPVVGNSQIRGPVSGVIYHRASRTLRPTLGVPGSAYIGSAVAQDIDAAFVSPDGNCAFATRGSDRSVICGLLDGPTVTTPISDVLADVTSVAWNRKGDTAAVYSSGRTLQLIRIRGRGEAVVTGTAVDLSSLSGAPTTLAVSEDGRQVAVGVEGALYRISDDGSLALAALIGKPTSAVFGNRGNTIYAIDQIAHEIRIVDAASSVNAITLADADAPDPQAVGLAVSEDGGKVWVALASQPAVRVYETATGRLQSEQALEVAPVFVQRITSGSLYLLNTAENKGDPYLVLRTGDQSGVFFIPACEDCL